MGMVEELNAFQFWFREADGAEPASCIGRL